MATDSLHLVPHTKLYCASEGNGIKSSPAPKRSGFYSKPSVGAADLSSRNPTATGQNKQKKVPNAVKSKSLEDMKIEDVRLTELDTLLDTFYGIIEDKEQLIALEEGILEEMLKERKTALESDRANIDITAIEKRNMLELERICCKNISTLASSLAVEIYDTREMVAQTRSIVSSFPDFLDEDTAAIDDIKQSTYIEVTIVIL